MSSTPAKPRQRTPICSPRNDARTPMAGFWLAAVHYTAMSVAGFVLVDRFASPRYVEREAATRMVARLGPAGCPAVYLGATSRDPERRARCSRLPGGDVGPRWLACRLRVLALAVTPYHSDWQGDDAAARDLSLKDPVEFYAAACWVSGLMGVEPPSSTSGGREQIDWIKVHRDVANWNRTHTSSTKPQ